MTGKILSSKELSRRIRNLRKNNYFYKTSKILNNENVKTFLHNFQKQFVIVPIDKAATTFLLFVKNFTFQRFSVELG